MDVERLAKELILKGMTSEQQKAVLDSIKSTMTQAREVQKQRIGENVQVVVQALKKIEGDIRSRYDEVGNKIEKRVASLKDGQDGRDGKDGKDGKDGRPGRDGAVGPAGARGTDGLNGRDGEDGVSVTDAKIDFDGSLVITLSTGREINVGEVVAPDLAEKIKVITNGGGTSQSVLDAIAALQAQIDTLIPSQTGNAGKYLTTDGTSTSWATVAGGGAVDSVNGQTGVVVLDAADVGAEPADATILKDADIGVTVQGYSSVLAGTTASFTTADETKLDGIEAGADVTDAANVEPLVDAHLNTATATTDQVLSWNGTGYDWVDQSGGGGGGALTISNKTAAYTVVAGDLGTIINCTSGTFTVSLTAAATLGAGFNVTIWNTGTGVITINPSGTETVDGVDPTTEFQIVQGTGAQLVCTGTAWLTGSTRNSGAASIGVLGTQLGRNSAGQMAIATTGQGAVALGGSYASGADSFAAVVANNTSSYGATGPSSVAIGYLTKASGNSSVAVGYLTTAESDFSVALGGEAVSTGYGKYVYGSGNFGGTGLSQTGTRVLRRQTTNATAGVLTADGGSSASSTNQIILPDNSAYAFSGIIVARQQVLFGGSASAAWEVKGLIRREGSAGSTTLVASTVTVISNVPGWTLALSANTSLGGLTITATGAAATNIRWLATIQTSEVTYA